MAAPESSEDSVAVVENPPEVNPESLSNPHETIKEFFEWTKGTLGNLSQNLENRFHKIEERIESLAEIPNEAKIEHRPARPPQENQQAPEVEAAAGNQMEIQGQQEIQAPGKRKHVWGW